VLVIEPRTWDALVAAVPHTRMLSAERVREELLKIVGKTPHASAALRLYADAGVLRELYPELQALIGLELTDASGVAAAGRPESAADNAWWRTLRTVDALPPARPLLRVAALLHAIGMPLARSRHLSGEWRYTGHEILGARAAEQLLRRLRFSNADVERVSTLVEKQSDLFPPDAPDSGVRRWLLHVPPELVPDLFRLRIALWRAHPVSRGDRDLLERWQHVRRVLASRPVLTTGGLAIDGSDLKMLGLTPGPQFGTMLRALLDRVIEDPSLNEREALLRLARELAQT
jgi:tRNA nucleotidyltransferase/poly(A) polymerase